MSTVAAHRLYDPAEHEPLADVEWSDAAARDGVFEIVADALAACDDGLWPFHVDDRADGEVNPEHASCVYLGAAGVVLALDWLAREAGTPALESAGELW